MKQKIIKQIKNFIQRLRATLTKNFVSTKKPSTDYSNPEVAKLSGKQTYFVEARSWADDVYTATIASRNRYQLAFFITMGLCLLLLIAIDGLIPLQHMEPLLVNHYADGRVMVQPLKQAAAPLNQAEVESDLVRYVRNRESYDASSYHTQYELINLLSNAFVAKQYMREQASQNKTSPINVLANRGFRAVHVDSVLFLDSVRKNISKPAFQHTHHNLAQINFTVTDHLKNSSVEKTKALTVLISWTYSGVPSDPSARWQNWNGFTVTRYSKVQRNVIKSGEQA